MEKLNLYIKDLIKDYLNLEENKIVSLGDEDIAIYIDEDTRILIRIDPQYYGMYSVSLSDSGNIISKSLFENYDELESQLQYGFKKLNRIIEMKNIKHNFIEGLISEFRENGFTIKITSRNIVADSPNYPPIFVRTKFDRFTIAYRYANLAPSLTLFYNEEDPSKVATRMIRNLKATVNG